MRLSLLTLVAFLIGVSITNGAEVNVSITSDYLNIRRYGIQWLSSSVGFALVEDDSVKMTDDFGKTWKNTTIGAGSQVHGIFTQDASNGTVAVFLGNQGHTYWTKDAGKTITLDTSFPNASWIEFHPINKEWAILAYEPQRNSTLTFHATLNFLSGDQTHWSPVHNNAWEVTWCAPNPTKARVCMLFDLNQGDRQLCVSENFLDCSYPAGTVSVEYIHQTPEYLILIAKGAFYVSMDEAETFNKAELPGGLPINVADRRQFLDNRRKTVWFAEPVGEFTNGKPQNGNVFVSDREGFKFNLALRNIHSFQNVYDFASVQSLNGTYIANEMFEYAGGYYVSPQNTTLSKTRITYDYGASWSFLRAPEVDRNNKTIVCGGICSLNLFGYSSLWSHNHYSQIYSKQEAVGIIVASGNVGDFLDWDEQNVNTYVSHDGGRHWREAFEGSWDYAYAQTTGILVLIKPGNETSDFHWSTDDGDTFTVQKFSPVDLTVYRIYNFDTTGEHFIIEASQNGEFVLITLDFTGVYERKCAASDLYLWVPENAAGDNVTCLNGEIITYQRRKHNAECSTTVDGTIYKTEACACTREDFECDYNYSPMVNGNCFGVPPPPPSSCKPGDTYPQTQGYRKTADNKCVGESPYDYKDVPCPGGSTTTGLITTTGTVATTGSTATTGQATLTTLATSGTTGVSSITTGERIIDRGVSSGGAAAGIIIVAIFVGIAAFVLGVVAAFRSSKVRGVVPQDWKSGESARLL